MSDLSLLVGALELTTDGEDMTSVEEHDERDLEK